jgi:hypothetical protein
MLALPSNGEIIAFLVGVLASSNSLTLSIPQIISHFSLAAPQACLVFIVS